MPKYIVSGMVTISCFTEVEAGSEDEAKKIAKSRPNCGMCDPHRSGYASDEYWNHSGEMDGEPTITAVELS